MKEYIMALDQGTTSSRCILFDKSGNICSMAQKEFTQIYPQPGWVEHNPKEIISTQFEVARMAMRKIYATAENICSIGITNQRETTVVWNKNTGEPVYNAIVWQCRRSADRIKGMDETVKEAIRNKTGLVPDAYFSASKIEWILDNVEGARQMAQNGELLFGTIDTWIVWNLTKGKLHITDYTNASRTMLFDINRLCWDNELLEYFHVPQSMLPTVVSSSDVYGVTDKEILGDEIVISGIAGDQQAALFGQCCFEEGDAKNTYGTGCFLLMNTGDKRIESKHGLVTTLAAGTNADKPQYALEGSVFIGGAAIQWLRDEMKLIDNAADSLICARAVDDTAGVYIVPAFTGLGAPYWKPYCKGTVTGITRGCTRNHFVRATLESVAYQSNDLIKAMKEDAAGGINSLRVDGGACANDFLMQFQADISETTVVRPSCIETTALGAAYLAGLATGYYESTQDIRMNASVNKSFIPAMEKDKRQELLSGWDKAINCALSY